MNKKEKSEARCNYPGAATDKADNNKVSECRVDAATKMQNNNPRADEVKRKS